MQQPPEKPVVEAATSDPPPAIIDVSPQSVRWAMGIVFTFLIWIPMAFLLIPISNALPPVEWLRRTQPQLYGMMFGLSVGLFFLVAMKGYAPFLRNKLRRDLQPGASSSLANVLSNALPFTSFLMKQYLQTTARLLAESGIVGTTIRVCEERYAKPVEPLTLIIEPLPLDESVPAVSRIASGDFVQPPGQGGDLYGESNAYASDNLQLRAAKRRISLFGGWAMSVVIGLWWLTFAVISIKNGRLSLELLLITALLIAVFFGPFRRGAMTSRQQWLIVPGGLIGRRTNWRGGWDVHLFERRSSALAVHRVWSQWMVSVANAETHQAATITPNEVTALLRAWLSPLPPPPKERLAELAG